MFCWPGSRFWEDRRDTTQNCGAETVHEQTHAGLATPLSALVLLLLPVQSPLLRKRGREDFSAHGDTADLANLDTVGLNWIARETLCFTQSVVFLHLLFFGNLDNSCFKNNLFVFF